jgi:hypothetical protein
MPFGVPLMVPMAPDAVDIVNSIALKSKYQLNQKAIKIDLGRRGREGSNKQTQKGLVATGRQP